MGVWLEAVEFWVATVYGTLVSDCIERNVFSAARLIQFDSWMTG